MASKRLLVCASDAVELSSLLVRRVLFTQPATLTAYREKTRRLLQEQAAPSLAAANTAAIALLKCDREINLMRYHGIVEYVQRWWETKQWPFSSRTFGSGSSGRSKTPNGRSGAEASVGRVAFMVTSRQREELATVLGYSAQDIRSFKPLEALLLLEHGIKKDSGDDFRVRLLELMEQEDRPRQSSPQNTSTPTADPDETGGDFPRNSTQQSVGLTKSEEVNTAPDAIIERGDTTRRSFPLSRQVVPGSALTSSAKISNTPPVAKSSPSAAISPPTADVTVTPHDAEKLHAKPDVAAALLAAQRRPPEPPPPSRLAESKAEEEDAGNDAPCWYEVVERVPSVSTPNGTRNTPAGETQSREQVFALFSTRKEALECIRIKRSLRNSSEKKSDVAGEASDDRFLVRRRWNA